MTKCWLLSSAFNISSASLLCIGLFACGGEPKVRVYADPSSLAVPTQVGGITAYVLKPTQTTLTDSPIQDIEIAAYTEDTAPLVVSISKAQPDDTGQLRQVGYQGLEAHGDPGPEQRFGGQIPLIHGPNRVQARLQTVDKSKVRTLDFTLEYFGQSGRDLGRGRAYAGRRHGRGRVSTSPGIAAAPQHKPQSRMRARARHCGSTARVVSREFAAYTSTGGRSLRCAASWSRCAKRPSRPKRPNRV